MDVWDLGDYGVVGDWFADASRAVLSGGTLPTRLDGLTLVDVACGTGAVAIAAARAGARVTGIDASATMLAEAQRRAHAESLDIQWHRGRFEDLSGVGPADFVTSAFGVMFAADPAAAARQLDAVARPDGTIAVAAWHPDGAFGTTPPGLVELIGPRPVEITRWADPEEVGAFFAGTRRTVVHHRRGTLSIPFADVAGAVVAMRRFSGPWIAVFEQLDDDMAERAARILTEHLESRSQRTPSGIELLADYTITHVA
jgi:SAM-dependent methyltransferase